MDLGSIVTGDPSFAVHALAFILGGVLLGTISGLTRGCTPTTSR